LIPKKHKNTFDAKKPETQIAIYRKPIYLYQFHKTMLIRRLFLIFTLVSALFQAKAEKYIEVNENSFWINRLSFTLIGQPDRYVALGDFESIAIPIKRAGKLILVDAIADSVSGSLILDTGATGLVLNSIYFRDGRPKHGYVTGGVTGKLEQVQQKIIGNFHFNEVSYQNIRADLTDLGHLESARQTKIIGFFGLILFRNFEVVLDLKNNLLELHRLNKNGERLNSQSQQPVPDLELPIYNYSDVYFVEGKISNKRYTFCLDTGAEANVLHNYLPDKIMNTITILRRNKLRGSGKQSTEVFYGLMNDFSIGDRAINGMQTLVTNLNAMSEAYGQQIDGMLGCAFFEKRVFYFNTTKKTLGICFYKADVP